MKIHLVDGPGHGNTIQCESDMPRNIYVPGIYSHSSLLQYDDVLNLRMTMPRHHYIMIAETQRMKTRVYEYVGETNENSGP